MRIPLLLLIALLLTGCFGPTLVKVGFVKVQATDVATAPYKAKQVKEYIEKPSDK